MTQPETYDDELTDEQRAAADNEAAFAENQRASLAAQMAPNLTTAPAPVPRPADELRTASEDDDERYTEPADAGLTTE